MKNKIHNRALATGVFTIHQGFPLVTIAVLGLMVALTNCKNATTNNDTAIKSDEPTSANPPQILQVKHINVDNDMLFAGTYQDNQGTSKFFVNVNKHGVILDGYDPVSFFTENKPVKGSDEIYARYHDATYHFTSDHNKTLFEADPGKYEVQFGGWCAYAVALGRVAPIDVDTYSIINGRLVVQHNQRAVRGWNKDPQGNLAKADKYWPEVARGRGKQIVTNEEKGYLVNTDEDGILLNGHDPVAYFMERKAVKGSQLLTARYQGATYQFYSEKNQTIFKDNPQKYAPQYGGFCAYAMAKKKLRPIDINIFQFVEGRLMFQHTQKAYDLFNRDTQGFTKRADDNWPKLVKARGGKSIKFDMQYDPPAN